MQTQDPQTLATLNSYFQELAYDLEANNNKPQIRAFITQRQKRFAKKPLTDAQIDLLYDALNAER